MSKKNKKKVSKPQGTHQENPGQPKAEQKREKKYWPTR